MTDLEWRLLNDFQRDFPLLTNPFSAMAASLAVTESEVLDSLTKLQQCGKVSRVGAVFKPHRIGSSTLAALAVPLAELEAVAQLISDYVEVNHNYQREHHYNLWFVITAATEQRIQQVLNEIELRTGYPLLNLPLLEDFHIDLGFDLVSRFNRDDCVMESARRQLEVKQFDHFELRMEPDNQNALIGAIQLGMPLVPQPYAEIGKTIGLNESAVIAGIANLLEQGIIKRFGVVVRHHELGFRSNAMVVWDIPDEQVSALGQQMGGFNFVSLCYRRPRRLPAWRYNLFTMIHGQNREEVLTQIAQLKSQCELENESYEVLFSCRRFKQRGAHYVVPNEKSIDTVCDHSGMNDDE
jgi:DNA-binding Lrp family transcriptional regulator